MASGLGDFAYSGIHVKPDDAVAEIDHLVDVFDGIAAIWGSTVSMWVLHPRGSHYHQSRTLEDGSLEEISTRLAPTFDRTTGSTSDSDKMVDLHGSLAMTSTLRCLLLCVLMIGLCIQQKAGILSS